MRGIILAGAVVVASMMAGAATAGERTGYSAIASGDLVKAERTLVAERRIFPTRPELMLNLAAVYQQTSRRGAAASLYRDVLAQPAVTMDMPDGTMRSSHEIADLALSRFASVAVANR